MKEPVALNGLSKWKPKHGKVNLTTSLVSGLPVPMFYKKIPSKPLSELTPSW